MTLTTHHKHTSERNRRNRCGDGAAVRIVRALVGLATFVVVLAVVAIAPRLAHAQAADELPPELRGVSVDEHLGDKAKLDVTFTDHNGEKVELADYFDDGIPVLLTLNYYECKMLCSIQLNGLLQTLKALDWAPGDNYRIVTISIDPREDWKLARDKRQSYLEDLDKGDVDWTFLVGEEANIRLVADSVGFGYRYDARQDQYAHVAVLMFLSEEGKITRYLYGLEFRPFDVKMALQEAGDGEIGDPLERVIFSCFHYDPESGQYGLWAYGVMRLGGIVTVVVLAVFLAFMFWREKRQRRSVRQSE